MFRPLLALTAAAGLASAAEDLTVLKPEPGGTPPRKMLQAQLLAECQTHLAARKAAVEKLKTPADIAAYQSGLRAKFVAAIGGFPEKTPLNARTVGVEKRAGYRVERVVYESRPNHHVSANLYLPDAAGPVPGVVMPLGHSTNGKAAEYMQRGAILLAMNGLAALVYDPIGQGERMQLLDKLGAPAIKGSTSEHTMVGVGALLVGRGTASYRIWDGIRSIDYLCSRPEIDAKRIGASGCSGGGTLTAYLMALDDRIAAAAPSCYLTSLDRLFNTLGPQDAEQNVTGQVAFGMDHADYVLMRAPKPTIILASTRDFFDIQGTWDTFRQAKRVYTTLGFPERVDMLEADNSHGYPKSHREGMVRFFRRWLVGKDEPVTEPDFPIAKDQALWCTRSGQVLEDLKGKSVFDLNAERAAELAKGRAAKEWKAHDFRAEVAGVLGLPVKRAAATREDRGTVARDGYELVKVAFDGGDRFPVPALAFRKNAADRGPWVVLLHERGKEAVAAPGGRAEQLVKAGKRVLALDPRGVGETAPGVLPTGRPPSFGVEFKESFLGFHLSRPLLGRKTADVLAVVEHLLAAEKGAAVEVVGVGAAGPVALHAAALDPRIAAVTVEGTVPSWELVVRTPISANQLVNVVPGALAVYDLPELAAAVAPRPLTVRGPVDPVGEPLAAGVAEAEFRAVKAAYAKAGAADKFSVGK